jgi:hypothetical protein
MRNRIRLLLVSTALLALGVLLAGCSATPLPPLLIPPPTAAGDQAPTSAAQLAVAPAVDAPAPAMDVVTITEAISATAVEPAVAETPAQVAAIQPTAPAQPTATPTRVAPTATPMAQKQVVVPPTVKPTIKPTRAAARSTVAPTPTRLPARPTPTRVKPTATPEWPKTLTITEQQLEQQASSVPGLQVTGLDVSFDNNSMTLSAATLRYSIVSIKNLTVQGHFTASNCDVTFVADSIKPRNLATSSIPNVVNQSIDQQLGQWCVETISIVPGELVATVRPR